MRRVTLHIERVVLTGFERAGGEAIAEGLRAELGRALEGADTVRALTSAGDAPRLHAEPARIERGALPLEIGIEVARSIAKGLAP